MKKAKLTIKTIKRKIKALITQYIYAYKKSKQIKIRFLFNLKK